MTPELLNAWTWVTEHQAEIYAALGALWTAASVIVRLTPTQEDDKALTRLRRYLERFSFLAPRNSPARMSMPGVMPPRPEESDEG